MLAAGIELWELPTADEGRLAEVSVGEAEATRHPELAATVAAVAGWLAAPEFDGATVVLFDGRHAEDLAGFDWPEYRVRQHRTLQQCCLRSGQMTSSGPCSFVSRTSFSWTRGGIHPTLLRVAVGCVQQSFLVQPNVSLGNVCSLSEL